MNIVRRRQFITGITVVRRRQFITGITVVRRRQFMYIARENCLVIHLQGSKKQ
jgi:hypothetical protein